MTDLPDVNVLVALHLPNHEGHERAVRWLEQTPTFATTPVTEAGFVRLMLNPAIFGPDASARKATEMLTRLKTQPHALFVPDLSPVDTSAFLYALSGPKQVTDLHLLDVARSRAARLVTFDGKLKASLRPLDRKHVVLL